MQYSSKDILLALATGIASMGGFPTPPKKFQDLTKNEMFQWTLVFILIWQGGAKQDIKLAGLVTAAMFALYKSLSN